MPDKKITMFSNTALHLSGQQRPIGAYVMANGTSLTFFRPQPLSASIISLGGVTVFLSLISMSDSIEMLYASLKALVNCTLHQPDMIKQMEEQRQFDVSVHACPENVLITCASRVTHREDMTPHA